MSGDCLEKLKEIESNSLDSLVTDPPAGISFMGKDWDGDKGGRDAWVAWMRDVMKECLRVLKPGAHGLVWALPRTSHWTATALEDAGFEIRDVVTHLFGQGFPKSLDISKAIDKAAGLERPRIPGGQAGTNAVLGARKAGEAISDEAISDEAIKWSGWGTALKPASEHWILVRKPISEKTVAANVLKWGAGAINVDASRIGFASDADKAAAAGRRFERDQNANRTGYGEFKNGTGSLAGFNANLDKGRFPANITIDEYAARMLDEQSGGVGGASRFFYVAKASKADKGTENTHPTVKSTALMQYLIKLVTPPGGTVLDPFMGSGSTGVACKQLGFGFVGIEREAEYFEIARRRIACDR